MTVVLKPLTVADVAAHNDAEDAETIRWLTGQKGTAESTRRHFALLATNAKAGQGKQGFGVVLDGRLAGYVDADPAVTDGLQAGDVNVSYATHPWARGRGVAVDAVALIAEVVRDNELGTRLALRIDIGNTASLRVAEKAGFERLADFVSDTDVEPDGSPARMALCVRMP